MDMNKLIPLLSEMAIFVNVVESGSFSKSALKLGVAPSSISRSITRLENALQQKLLERTTRQMRLSPAGQEVYSLCCDMLNSAQLAVSSAQVNTEDITGVLRVAAPKALSKQVLMPMLLDFMALYPKVELQLKVSDRYLDLVSHEVDVIIHITETPTEGLISRVLAPCRLLLCATPDYLMKQGIPTHPQQLIDHNCICLGESPKDRIWIFSQEDKKLSIQVKGTLTVNHSEIRREAVLRSMGIAVFPDFSIQEWLDTEQVQQVLPDWTLGGHYQGNIVAQYAYSKFIPKQIKTLVDYLQTCFQS